jgi:hypothetical protein
MNNLAIRHINPKVQFLTTSNDGFFEADRGQFSLSLLTKRTDNVIDGLILGIIPKLFAVQNSSNTICLVTGILYFETLRAFIDGRTVYPHCGSFDECRGRTFDELKPQYQKRLLLAHIDIAYLLFSQGNEAQQQSFINMATTISQSN